MQVGEGTKNCQIGPFLLIYRDPPGLKIYYGE